MDSRYCTGCKDKARQTCFFRVMMFDDSDKKKQQDF